MMAEDRSSDPKLCVRAGKYPTVRKKIQRLKRSRLCKFKIMALMLDYPDNWREIAATVKQAAGYRCNRCGLKCLPPNNSYRHLDLSLRRKLSAQVHHLDGNPARNDRSNLVCLCSGCHLRMHRHRPQPTPGQLSLKLKLPKIRRSRQHKQNWQLTLADLIDRLPRLSGELHQQLELDLNNNSLERQLSLDNAK